MGSLVIGGTFWAMLEVREDPDDPHARLIAQSKSNSSAPSGALRYRIESATTAQGIETVAVGWEGVLEGVTAQELDRRAERARTGARTPRAAGATA
jgi:hypothetical protein